MSFGRAAVAVAVPRPGAPCPCGSGESFGGCCGPLLDGAPAPSAERLMRSRYTAFALHDRAHLERTWHPRTRPREIEFDPTAEWTGLEVLLAEESGSEAVVAFRARWRDSTGAGVLAERSAFVRRAGRWVYVEGQASAEP